jgi:hypothetical protein
MMLLKEGRSLHRNYFDGVSAAYSDNIGRLLRISIAMDWQHSGQRKDCKKSKKQIM